MNYIFFKNIYLSRILLNNLLALNTKNINEKCIQKRNESLNIRVVMPAHRAQR